MLETGDIVSRISELPDAERAAIIADAMQACDGLRWMPLPGPQTQCLFTPAHLTYFGGAGGGGKSDALLGMALTQHRSSLLIRRQYTDLSGLVDRCLQIHGSRKGFNGSSPPRLTTDDGRVLDFGACARPGDEQSWQGRPHDFLGVDEAAQLHEHQIRYLMGWVRSTIPGQRTRVVLASNPPLTSEGEWLYRWFSPWLDSSHPVPAKPGELRWYVTDENGSDLEVDSAEPVELDGEIYTPLSRTFIPAALADNPFLMATNYRATLDALPEPLRSAIRDGNFDAAVDDDLHQIIPTSWIKAAQDRWTMAPPLGQTMSAIGVDPAGGGRDETVLAMRYGYWFDQMVAVPGREMSTGSGIAGLVITKRRDDAPVVVDMGGGYGSSVFEHLQSNNVNVFAHRGAERSMARAKDRKLGFYNKRSEAWWLFREALDPDQVGGSAVALPPDNTLVSDLASTRFQTTTVAGRLVLQAEPKTDVIARLGRSPDRGDAVVMSWSMGNLSGRTDATPQVLHGHESKKRKR
jgi:hypothetical protein